MDDGRLTTDEALKLVDDTVDFMADNIAVLVEGLHAQVFGVHSLGDPQLSHDALADGGQIHEVVHALVRALPASGKGTPCLAALAQPQAHPINVGETR